MRNKNNKLHLLFYRVITGPGMCHVTYKPRVLYHIYLGRLHPSGYPTKILK